MPSRRMSYQVAIIAMFVSALDLRAQRVQSDSSAPVGRDTSGSRSSALRVLPVIGSAPETGFVGGVTAIRVSRPVEDSITRPSTEQLYAAYTAKQQIRAFASVDRWTRGNAWGLNAQLEYALFPQPFFGIGIDAPESAEEWYEARSVVGTFAVRKKLGGDTYGQIGFRRSETKIRDADVGGAIASGGVWGARGGVVSQAVVGVAADSRDNVFAASSGTFAQATASFGTELLGSDYRFAKYTIDARRYWRVGPGVFAGQGYIEATSSRAPFDHLSLVGSGNIMRGYVRGRYRDNELAAAQLEYRLPIAGRFGVAAFAGAGTVAPRMSELVSSTLLPTFGAGARWLLLPKQRTTVRVDYGMGKGSSGLYVAFNEAF